MNKENGIVSNPMEEWQPVEMLKNIDNIDVDISKTIEQRMRLFLQEIENPYYFLCGNTPVRICFAEEGEDLRKRLLNYFIGLK